MDAIASQITNLTIVYSTVHADANKKKHQSSASLAFVWGIHRGPVNSPHKWPVTRKMFPFDDVIMNCIETIQGFPLLHILFVLRKHWWWCLLWGSGHVYRKSFVPEIMVDGAHLMIWCNLNSGMVITVITCPVKCGVKLLIHSQTLTAQPTQQSNFISHCIMGVITFPCRDYS